MILYTRLNGNVAQIWQNWSLWSFLSTFTPTLNNTYYFVYRKKLQSEMFKQNIPKLRYCAFKMSLMSNLNRYIFSLNF